MEKRHIFVTVFDLKRLNELLRYSTGFDERDKTQIKLLKKKLQEAKIYSPKVIPEDIITMNSKVRLKDIYSEEELIYTLVYPVSADINKNKISILAPIGVALLGHRVGEIVDSGISEDLTKFRIEEILYQPEAAGEYCYKN
jgi:regulator of nucleoside diphosphate kinase